MIYRRFSKRQMIAMTWWNRPGLKAYDGILCDGAVRSGKIVFVPVAIRDKLNRGKKLEKWEQEYYKRNKNQVKMQKKYPASELTEQERLQKLLG